MENFKFKSAICTSIEQSKRLLELGLKMETADCHWFYHNEHWEIKIGFDLMSCENLYPKYYIPAWSFGRLIKDLMPQSIEHLLELAVGSNYAGYYEDKCDSKLGMHWEYAEETPDMFDNIISTIEWLIKEGYFNKEYLKQ